MPLIHSASKAALKQNMRTLHNEVGESPHVQSPEQATAIALSTQRRAKAKKAGKAKAKPKAKPKSQQIGADEYDRMTPENDWQS